MKDKAKRAILGTMLSVFMCFAMLGCSQAPITTSKSEEELVIEYADQDFLDAVSSGLYSRWDAKRAETEEVNASAVISYIDIELRYIEPFIDKDFENGELKTAGKEYVENLNAQKAYLRNESTSTHDAEKEYLRLLTQRSKMIEEFVEEFGLVIDDAHYADYSLVISQGAASESRLSAIEIMDGVLDRAEFSLVDDSYGLAEYAATIENATPINFLSFTMQINILDENGVIIESCYAEAINWKAGTSVKLSFMTTYSFSSVEIVKYVFEM